MPVENRENEIPENQNENQPRKRWQTPIIEELRIKLTLGSGGSAREAIGTKHG
jgi:hypothetical protein